MNKNLLTFTLALIAAQNTTTTETKRRKLNSPNPSLQAPNTPMMGTPTNPRANKEHANSSQTIITACLQAAEASVSCVLLCSCVCARELYIKAMGDNDDLL